jgi:hypothetical protein
LFTKPKQHVIEIIYGRGKFVGDFNMGRGKFVGDFNMGTLYNKLTPSINYFYSIRTYTVNF